MRVFDWNDEKNEKIKRERSVSFERVLLHIAQGNVLDILEHPNQTKYAGQRILVVEIDGYAYIVPFVDDGEKIFLKTIIPSRKLTKKYLQTEEHDA